MDIFDMRAVFPSKQGTKGRSPEKKTVKKGDIVH